MEYWTLLNDDLGLLGMVRDLASSCAEVHHPHWLSTMRYRPPRATFIPSKCGSLSAFSSRTIVHRSHPSRFIMSVKLRFRHGVLKVLSIQQSGRNHHSAFCTGPLRSYGHRTSALDAKRALQRSSTRGVRVVERANFIRTLHHRQRLDCEISVRSSRWCGRV